MPSTRAGPKSRGEPALVASRAGKALGNLLASRHPHLGDASRPVRSMSSEDPPPASALADADADPPPLEAENSLAEHDLDGSLADDDVAPDDLSLPEADADVRDPAPPAPEGTGAQTDAADDPDAPVEEFPPDNTPDVVVTFVILPEDFRHVMRFKASTAASEIKRVVAADLPLPLETISLRYADDALPDDVALVDVGVHPGDEIEVELVVTYVPPSVPERAPAPLPSALEVRVPGDVPGDEPRVVRVSIDASACQKPRYLGGYRNKRDGTVYHHAQMQTVRQRPRERVEKFTTETQTTDGRSRVAQTKREAATQMKRKDLLLDDSRDVTVHTGLYVTADELWALKERKALVLQRYARGMRARRLRDARRIERDAAAKARDEEEKAAKDFEERARAREIERRMNPRTPADFHILRRELATWMASETAKLNAAHPPPGEGEPPSRARASASKALLARETKLMLAIERLRKAADVANREDRVAEALDDMAATKRWENKDGSLVVVDTPFTVRARELRELYRGMRMENLAEEDRLEVLLHVKWTVKEFDCNLTREIVELIDREADLSARGRAPATMAGLRRRLANLFLQFVETPEFNPESARYSVAALAAREAETMEQLKRTRGRENVAARA